MQQEFERYQRNIIIDKIGTSGQSKLLESKVLVAGAGGLGSTAIVNLASMGIGTIGIIDNDKLELSNLNRQYIHKYNNIGVEKTHSAKKWIAEFNPDIDVKSYTLRLNDSNVDDILKEFDLVMDCFDSFKSKFMLNRACIKNNKPLIHAGVSEFGGQLKTIIPKKTSCLGCLFPNADVNDYGLKGVFCPAISAIASMQSMEAANYFLGLREKAEDVLITYDALNQRFRKLKLKRNLDCPVCG